MRTSARTRVADCQRMGTTATLANRQRCKGRPKMQPMSPVPDRIELRNPCEVCANPHTNPQEPALPLSVHSARELTVCANPHTNLRECLPCICQHLLVCSSQTFDEHIEPRRPVSSLCAHSAGELTPGRGEDTPLGETVVRVSKGLVR